MTAPDQQIAVEIRTQLSPKEIRFIEAAVAQRAREATESRPVRVQATGQGR